MTHPIDTAELRRLAEAATPKEWVREPNRTNIECRADNVGCVDGGGYHLALIFADGGIGEKTATANAAHIAANHPQQTIALCDEIDARRKRERELLDALEEAEKALKPLAAAAEGFRRFSDPEGVFVWAQSGHDALHISGGDAIRAYEVLARLSALRVGKKKPEPAHD